MHAQSCLTLYNLLDCSPPGSWVHGIFQARYWGGLPFPSLGNHPNPGMEPTTPASPALVGRFFATGPPGKCTIVSTSTGVLMTCDVICHHQCSAEGLPGRGRSLDAGSTKTVECHLGGDSLLPDHLSCGLWSLCCALMTACAEPSLSSVAKSTHTQLHSYSPSPAPGHGMWPPFLCSW